MVKKVANLFQKKNSVAAASVILMITLFLSNVLGVVRDHYLTQKVPTDLLSCYYAAFRIPDLIFNILILGTITSAFIPIFTNLIAREKEKEAWQVASSVVNIAMIALIVLSLILAVIMPWIMPFVVPGFSIERQNLTTELARIMLLSPIFFGLSYVFGGILNSYKRFLIYSLAPLVYNLTIIVGTLVLADRFGIFGVAFAVITGAFLHFLIQLPVAIKLGFRFHWQILWQHWGVKRIGLLMIPRALALGANQIMLLIFTGMASSMGGYSIAAYNLADNIQTMPLVVFGTSFATAIFPALSESVSQNRFADFSEKISKVSRTILFFMIPMTLILIVLRTEIVRLLFGSGHFGWDQTLSTANTLAYLSLSLVFAGLAPLFSRAFYALHNTRTPMIITVISVVFSILFGKILSMKMGVEGLALGYSIGTLITTVLLYWFLRKKVNLDKEKEIIWFSLKVILSSLVMAFAIYESKNLVGMVVNLHRTWGIIVQTGLSLLIGLIVFLLFAWIFRLEEINSVTQIWQRYARRPLDESEKPGE